MKTAYRRAAHAPSHQYQANLLASFNFRGFVGVLNTPRHRQDIAFVLLHDDTVITAKDITAFEYDPVNSKITVRHNGRASNVQAILNHDTSVLTIHDRAIRWLRGSQYEALIDRLMKAAEKVKGSQPPADNVLSGIVAGDTASLGTYIKSISPNTIRRLKGKFTLSDYQAEEVLSHVQMHLAEKMLTGTWAYTDKPSTIPAFIQSCIDNRTIDTLRRKKVYDRTFVSEAALSSPDEGDDNAHDFLNAYAATHSADSSSDLVDSHMSQYDYMSYIGTIKSYVREHPRSPIRHLVNLLEAQMMDEDITQESYAHSIGMKSNTFKEHIRRARRQLNEMKLGPEALKSGVFPTPNGHKSTDFIAPTPT